MRGPKPSSATGPGRAATAVVESGFHLYDEAMAALDADGAAAALHERIVRLRDLATGMPADDAEGLSDLADALERDLEPGSWTPLAQAEELVGWACDPELDSRQRRCRLTLVHDRLCALRTDHAAERRSIAVLGQWVMMVRERERDVP